MRYPDPTFGKRETGLAEKPDDKWTVPLNAVDHRLAADAQHAGNERGFWRRHRIDPVKVACALWACSGDTETALIILREARAS